MSIASFFSRPGASGFGASSTAEQVTDGLSLAGKRYLLTGANSGIGLETGRVLALRGATVVCAARTVDKAAEAARGFATEIIPVACELSEPASVRACIEHVRGLAITLDGIIANAGIMALPTLEVKHGLELQFLTNHVGHFILVTGLLDRLAPDGRVTMLSSAAHMNTPRGGIDFDNLDGAKGYSAWSAYGRSKLANLLFAKALARRFGGSRRVANAVHPGVIATNLGRHMPSWGRAVLGAMEPLFLKSIPEGAATQTWAAVHPAAGEHNGEYLADCNVARASAHGRDTALATRLWEETEALVARM